MRCACSRTALCLTSLSLAGLLALRLPDGSRLKKPSPCLWKIEDFLCLRTGGAHGPYTRGLTAIVCARNRVRAFLASALACAHTAHTPLSFAHECEPGPTSIHKPAHMCGARMYTIRAHGRPLYTRSLARICAHAVLRH